MQEEEKSSRVLPFQEFSECDLKLNSKEMVNCGGI